MPMMLTLIEAIAGRERAVAVANHLGVAAWHDSNAFRLTRRFALTCYATLWPSVIAGGLPADSLADGTRRP